VTFERFGRERVGMVSAHQDLQRRARPLREGSRGALGLSLPTAARCARLPALLPCRRGSAPSRHIAVAPGRAWSSARDRRSFDRHVPLERAPIGRARVTPSTTKRTTLERMRADQDRPASATGRLGGDRGGATRWLAGASRCPTRTPPPRVAPCGAATTLGASPDRDVPRIAPAGTAAALCRCAGSTADLMAAAQRSPCGPGRRPGLGRPPRAAFVGAARATTARIRHVRRTRGLADALRATHGMPL
jgi:hypothetical protein